MGIWVIVCTQKASHYFLQTFCPLRMFKIVFRDCSLYPKQLSLFCLLWLISGSADAIGYITNICCMIELLHELKKSGWSIQAFDNVSARRKENLRTCKPECASDSPDAHLLYSTARIRRGISAVSFCSCKSLWRNDECVLPLFQHAAWYFLQLWTAVS